MAVTLAQLRKQFYNRFDVGAQNYIQTDEANTLINEGASHLHNWLVTEAEYLIWQESQIPLVPGVSDYPFAPTVQKLLKLFGPAYNPSSVSTPAWMPLHRIMPQEYRGGNMGALNTIQPFWPYGYMLMGQTLRIIPTPQKAMTLLMWYVPVYVDLVADTDTTELALVPGYQEFIINQAVIGARIKEESDTSALERRQQQIMVLMQAAMINRDMGQPQHVVDVSSY
jgi:hypothetical protein